METDGSFSHDLAMKKLKLGKATEGVGHPDFFASSGCFLVGYEGVLRGHGASWRHTEGMGGRGSQHNDISSYKSYVTYI